MFIRLSTIFFSAVALAGVATAAPTDLEVRDNVNQCNTGSIQCCDSTYSAQSAFIAEVFGYLGIPVPVSSSQVGLSCSPITVGGTSVGGSCTQQPVCCTGNTFNGFIGVGCSSISTTIIIN